MVKLKVNTAGDDFVVYYYLSVFMDDKEVLQSHWVDTDELFAEGGIDEFYENFNSRCNEVRLNIIRPEYRSCELLEDWTVEEITQNV